MPLDIPSLPQLSPAAVDAAIDTLSPDELEPTRRALNTELLRLTHEYGSLDDGRIPMILLATLSRVTAACRKRNAGPPKEPKAPRANAKATRADVGDLLSNI